MDGTVDGHCFLDKYFATGELIDLYSINFKSGKSHQPQPKNLSLDNREVCRSTMGALLLLALDPCLSAAEEDVKKIFPCLVGACLNGNGHRQIYDADFLLFNLITKQILAFGLGRKNRLFFMGFDASDNYAMQSFGCISPQDLEADLTLQPHFFQKFLASDPARVVPFLLNSLSMAGEGYEDNNPAFLNELIENGPDADGIFRDECGYEFTKDDLKEMKSAIKQADRNVKEGEAPFRKLFKGCSILNWELEN